ncbi:MAG TPA: FHA domain-containing protein [Thermoanaerobaculia bacterium]|nr:FHA domain-containing protein [Thermoanaerobaculia bacterium]
MTQDQDRATARDVVVAIGENMRQSLEPLVTKTVAPSLYQVYLHAGDYDHLRTLFGEMESEAKRLLDQELALLNREALPPVARLLSTVGLRTGPAPASRVVSAEGRWTVRFQEDPNGHLTPGEIEVVSEFAQRPAPGYGSGNPTHRISTTRRLGGRMSTERQVVETAAVDAYARITYKDGGGPQTFLVTKDEIVIGRDAPDVWVDLRLETIPDVSREHARIRRLPESGAFRLKDLSKLGTTVNGVAVPASVEMVDGEVRDRDQWVDLPERARIGLAGVLFLDFERIAPR